jgi:hypothetical protein
MVISHGVNADDISGFNTTYSGFFQKHLAKEDGNDAE